ncbi:MAG: hypothetical protein AB7O59_18685 [Pirellulales bacterium]
MRLNHVRLVAECLLIALAITGISWVIWKLVHWYLELKYSPETEQAGFALAAVGIFLATLFRRLRRK